MGIEPATEKSMQDNASDLEALLYPEAQEDEPIVTDDDEALDDGEDLPEDGDSDSEDDEGSDEEGLEQIAEDLSLAGYLGVDDERIVETEDGYVLNAIIDGETKQVPLSELASSYQLQGHVNNKSMALETERKEFDEVKNQVAAELQQRLQGVSKLGELAEQELVGEYNSINWDTLRTEDPANWTALRQEYAERAQKIQQVQSLAKEEGERLQAEGQQKFRQEAGEYHARELKALIADNPTWADDTVRATKVGEIRSFLSNYGFTEEDAEGVNDHRLIRLIKDAQAYKSGKKAAETKRVGKKLPKFQKPGGSRDTSANMANARKAKALKAKRKTSGKVQDVAASILDRM
jgi:hypothetical protein